MIKNIISIYFSREFLSFLTVGLFNTLIGYLSIMILLNFFKIDYWYSTLIGNSLGAIVSYFLNKKITFKSNNSNTKSFFKFIILIMICYCLSYGLSYFISYNLPNYLGIKTTINIIENIAVIVGMTLYTITNFLGQKYFVFSKI
jgi:putative flippase GtrA